MNPYEVLGIPKNSTEKEVRSKYLQLARKYHPDHNNGETTEKFQQIESAYRSVVKLAQKRPLQATKPPPKPPEPPEVPKPPPPPKFKKGQKLDDFLNDLMNDGRKKTGKKKDKWG